MLPAVRGITQGASLLQSGETIMRVDSLGNPTSVTTTVTVNTIVHFTTTEVINPAGQTIETKLVDTTYTNVSQVPR